MSGINNSDRRKVVISARNIHKDFHLPHEKNNSLKSLIVNVFKKKDKEIDTQHALRGVSFDIREGEFFGILGRNGSGKSTLLKILAGIYQPTKGTVKTSGKLVPFIELGVGFNPELTGRENVYLNGALLGFSKSEIDERYDEIVEFAELEGFMEQKLKNYSSGMQVRLAFSVATRADADILIVDEVLAVGDEAFQRKCNDYFFKLKRDKKTVILVTHSMENVRQFCDRAMLIDDGILKNEGPADRIADEYSKLFIDNSVLVGDDSTEQDKRWGTGKVKVQEISLDCNEDTFKVSVTLVDQGYGVGDVRFAIRVRDQNDYLVAGSNNYNTKDQIKLFFDKNDSKEIVFTSPNIFGNQQYTVETLAVCVANNEIFDSWIDALKFQSYKKATYYPIVLPATLEVRNTE